MQPASSSLPSFSLHLTPLGRALDRGRDGLLQALDRLSGLVRRGAEAGAAPARAARDAALAGEGDAPAADAAFAPAPTHADADADADAAATGPWGRPAPAFSADASGFLDGPVPFPAPRPRNGAAEAPLTAPLPLARPDMAPGRPVHGGPALLSGPVGPGRRNARRDVAMAQRLLNEAARAGAIPGLPTLSVDGIWGARSQAALLAAEAALTAPPPGARGGGLVPGGALLAALHGAALPRGPSMALLRLLWPSAPTGRLNRLGPRLLAMMERRAIFTDLRAAHFLAQVGHESGQLRWLEEIATGAAYEGRRDLGNVRPGDGRRFKGRGLIQLTGRTNYARFGAAMGCRAELLADPSLVSADPALAVETAGWFWSRNGLNALADRDDLGAVTRRINGGHNGLVERAAMLTRARALLGL